MYLWLFIKVSLDGALQPNTLVKCKIIYKNIFFYINIKFVLSVLYLPKSKLDMFNNTVGCLISQKVFFVAFVEF